MATTLSAMANLRITDGKSVKSKEFGRLKKKENTRDEKQSLIKL